MDIEKQRCAFCSQTSRPGLQFFKGLLSPLICSECVKKILFFIGNNIINNIDFTFDKGNKNDN